MTRKATGSGRVTAKGADADEARPAPARRRRPLAFWVVILAVLAMVLSTFAALVQVIV